VASVVAEPASEASSARSRVRIGSSDASAAAAFSRAEFLGGGGSDVYGFWRSAREVDHQASAQINVEISKVESALLQFAWFARGEKPGAGIPQ
jgi:hypothetical protein